MAKKKYLTPILLDLDDGGDGGDTGGGSGEGPNFMTFDDWLEHYEGIDEYDYNQDGNWDYDDYEEWLEIYG